MRSKSLAIIMFLGVFFPLGIVWSRTNEMKLACANCHTMHNSQGGNPVFGIVQQPALLTNTCYGCHSGENITNGMPMVHRTSTTEPFYMATGTEPTHTTLAGGSFAWVAVPGNDLKGHNVDGLATQVSRIPPGGTKTFGPDPLPPLTCAGTNGCHGVLAVASDILAIYQTHHAPEQTQPMDGSSLVKSYRLLNGIAGYEDPDYELTVSSGTINHNQYKGVARGSDTPAATTISQSCAECHGNFHSGAGDAGIWDGGVLPFGDPWIRHPVDYDMGGLGVGVEYLNYGPGGAYNVATPLGSASADVSAAPLSAVTLNSAAGDAIIVCVSCHRAHGSPYDYSLRWDYLSWPTAGYNGCGDCHTAKN